MSLAPLIDMVHIGPQKSGTTWLYRCLEEHPGIVTARAHNINFFDINFDLGAAYLAHCYPDRHDGRTYIDITPSYIRSALAAKRMYDFNPNMKIATCLRHPIERAFSHYWHEKKKGRFNYDFAEVFSNYDLYMHWIEPGFYAEHLEKYYDRFPAEQVLVQDFDDLQADPVEFFRQFCRFAGIDDTCRPSVIDQRINPAAPKNMPRRIVKNLAARAGGVANLPYLRAIANKLPYLCPESGDLETLQSMPPDTYKRLIDIFRPDVKRLGNLLGRDYTRWLATPGDGSAAKGGRLECS